MTESKRSNSYSKTCCNVNFKGMAKLTVLSIRLLLLLSLSQFLQGFLCFIIQLDGV